MVDSPGSEVEEITSVGISEMGDREGRPGLEVAIQESEEVSMKERGMEMGGDLNKAACFIAI